MPLTGIPRTVAQFRVNFDKYQNEFIGKPSKFMEIGVYLGNTARHLVNNVLTHPESKYVGIDPWDFEGTSKTKFPDDERGRKRFDLLLKNMETFERESKGKVTFHRGFSQDVLRDIHFARQWFDMIYIDGKHTVIGVMNDFVLTWPLLKVGGIMVFDDYGIKDTDEVKRGVDEILFGLMARGDPSELSSRRAFLFSIPRVSKIEVLEKNFQILIRKLAE